MSRNILKLSAVIASLLATALVSGCGTDNKETATSLALANVARVGDTPCFQCHANTIDSLTGETFIAQYQRSLHAEIGCESCHGGGAQHNGVGPFPFVLNSDVSDAQKAARCAMCHDGVTTFDGKVAPLSSSPNFQNGNHANPFSAEEAHEAKCARCHSHEGAILYGKDGFTGSQAIINNTAFQPVLARDPETFNTIKCATCHEHGGNIRQTKTRDAAGNVVVWDPNANKVTDQYDLCTSCHNLNTNEGMLIGSGNVLSVENTAAGFTNVSTAAYYHNTSWYRQIPSTHYDQPASGTTANGTTIEGYVIRKNTKNPCYDCHGHEFQTNTRRVDPAASASVKARPNTVFLDWAQSAHAGNLLTQKTAAAAANPVTGTRGTAQYTNSGKAQVDAVMKAGVTDASGIAWTHYNWDDNASRGSCQRCHTSTGASNFMKDPAGYNAANNSFTHLAGWTSSNKTSGQNELLYCWGCHQNAGTGKLYAPGARNEIYSAVTGGTTVTVSYPDIAGSNVCMTCHVGREVGENIKTITDADGVLGFVNSHYLAAGAQLFGKSGYEYDGRDYTPPAFFQHDKIGTAAAPGTGSNGPCVGCHMTSAKKHSFTNVSTSGGVITGITSTVCATCHTGQFALTPASLVAEEEEYEAALAGLTAALDAKGIFFYPAHPYFYKDSNANGIFDLGEDVNRNGVLDPGEDVNANGALDKGVDNDVTSGATSDAFTNWGGPYGVPFFKDTMGAAFNLNLLLHDPGGFAHNRFYAKRLIWDSIDFIDDGLMNSTVAATLSARLTGQTLTDAQAYLGTTRP